MLKRTLIALMVLANAAQADGFDPRLPCGDVLQSANLNDRTMIAAWTFGYIAANTGNTRPVDSQNNATLLRNIEQACAGNPNATLLALVAGSKKPDPNAAGSEAEARALLMKWYAPNADYEALTRAIIPTEQDIRIVYKDPLASNLVRDYASLMAPGTAFGPKPNHTDILVVHTSTGELVKQSAVLREFPGGYRDVLPYFQTDVPIVRFKFVEKGATSGYAFDGLVYVNGRWVLMPKPWRSLP